MVDSNGRKDDKENNGRKLMKKYRWVIFRHNEVRLFFFFYGNGN